MGAKGDESTARKFVGEYQVGSHQKKVIVWQDGKLFASVDGGERSELIVRENDSVSYQCTEDYFELKQDDDGSHSLVPVSIYNGEGTPQTKIK